MSRTTGVSPMNDALLNVMNQAKHKDWDIPDVVDSYSGDLLIVGSIPRV